MTERPVVLLTGSSGLIASAVSQRLLEHYTLVRFDREVGGDPPRGVECITADVSDQSSLAHALDELRAKHGTQLASVVHLAAYYDFSGEKSEKYDQVTIGGTERLPRAPRPS